MKKILLVANVAKEHVLKFHQPSIKMLSENGWQVDVACGGEELIPNTHERFFLPIDRSPFRTHFIKGIRQLKRIIAEGKYDIIYCHTSVGGIVGRISAMSARKKGTCVIKFAHGSYFYKGAPIWNWIYFPIYKVLSWVTDAIITITQEDFEFTQRHFSHAKTYYVPGIGIDPSRFVITDRKEVRQNYRNEMNIPADAFVLIYVAELIKNKNQRLLLSTLSILMKSRKDVYLLLVGPDHTNGEYSHFAEELGVTGHVRMLGWRKDIAELYAMSDICTASSVREGLGLNIIEAMCCDVPVIATDNSGHRAVIEHEKNGMLVPVNDANMFAKQILNLIDSHALRSHLVENAKKDISKYYNENVLHTISHILEVELNTARHGVQH